MLVADVFLGLARGPSGQRMIAPLSAGPGQVKTIGVPYEKQNMRGCFGTA